MEIKVSKIKSIAEVKPFTGNYGTILYHKLEMENGDKIDIGKKAELKTGWDLYYQIVGDPGQHEYTKAKSVKKDDVPPHLLGAPSKSNYTPDPDREKGIRVGHAINNAVQLAIAQKKYDMDSIAEIAQDILLLSDKIQNNYPLTNSENDKAEGHYKERELALHNDDLDRDDSFPF